MADYLDIDMGLVIDSKGNELKATPYFENYLYEFVRSIGGEGSTLVSDLESIALQSDKSHYFFSAIKALTSKVDGIINDTNNAVLAAAVKQVQIDTSAFIGKIKTSNYTAEDKDWVEARSGITVDLPADPLPNSQVMVSNGDGSTITVDGNGNNIKYTATDTTIVSNMQGTSLHFQYFIDAAENYWRVI